VPRALARSRLRPGHGAVSQADRHQRGKRDRRRDADRDTPGARFADSAQQGERKPDAEWPAAQRHGHRGRGFPRGEPIEHHAPDLHMQHRDANAAQQAPYDGDTEARRLGNQQ